MTSLGHLKESPTRMSCIKQQYYGISEELLNWLCDYYNSIGRRRTWRRRTARLEFLGNLRSSQAGISEFRTILKITANTSHSTTATPHRTQDILRVLDWQQNACTHFSASTSLRKALQVQVHVDKRRTKRF